jgi:hypothetical protein
MFSIESDGGVERAVKLFYNSKKQRSNDSGCPNQNNHPWLTWGRASRLKLSNKHARLFMDLDFVSSPGNICQVPTPGTTLGITTTTRTMVSRGT